MEKGKYVSRSVYAKLQAENNRLKKDIEVMVSGTDESYPVWEKWKKHFRSKKMFANMLQEILLNDIKPKLDSNPKAFK